MKMKLRRSRTLSARPRSIEPDISESYIDVVSWQVKESVPSFGANSKTTIPKLRLVRIPEQQRKHKKRSNKSGKNKQIRPSLYQFKANGRTKVSDTNLKSSWPVNDSVPKGSLPIPIEPWRREIQSYLHSIEDQTKKSLNLIRENRTENRLAFDVVFKSISLCEAFKRIAAGHGFVLNDEQRLLTCFSPIGADKQHQHEHQANEINGETDDDIRTIESRSGTIDELRLAWSDESEDNDDAYPVSPNGNQLNVLDDLLTITPNDQTSQLDAASDDELNTVETDAHQNSLLVLNNSLANECSTNSQREFIDELNCDELSTDADKENQVDGIDVETDGIDNSEFERANQPDDNSDATLVSATNQQPPHENGTNVSSRQLLATPNDQSSQDSATSDDESSSEFNGWDAVSDDFHSSLYAVKDSLANEYATNDQREKLTGADAENESENDIPPPTDTESDAKFHGWEETSVQFDANDFIDLTLDDDDFGQNIANTFHGCSNGAGQAQSTKPRPTRRRTFAGIQSKKQTQKQQHRCNLRQFSMPYTSSRARHLQTYMKEKPFECQTCSKRFVKPANLAEHMQIHQRKVYSCSNCHGKSQSKKAWKSHENLCKNGNKQYVCQLCDTIVFNKNHLEKHMRIHTGEVNRCPKCSKEFASELGLTHHMKKYAGSADFPHQCNVCFQVFSRAKEWKSHEKRCKLKQYVCDICDKSFVNNHHLSHHKCLN